MLAPEGVAVDKDVRGVDKDKIVLFAKLHEENMQVKEALKAVMTLAEELENGEEEVDLADEDDEEAVLYVVGQSFAVVSTDHASELIAAKREEAAAETARLKTRLGAIIEQQEALKRELKARFGDSINLES